MYFDILGVFCILVFCRYFAFSFWNLEDSAASIPTPRPAHRRLDGVDGRVDNHVVVGTSVEVVAALKVGDVTVAVAVLDLKRRKIDAENPWPEGLVGGGRFGGNLPTCSGKDCQDVLKCSLHCNFAASLQEMWIPAMTWDFPQNTDKIPWNSRRKWPISKMWNYMFKKSTHSTSTN